MNIEELIKELDPTLKVKEYGKHDSTIYITCEKDTNDSICPHCGEISNSVHSKYIRTVSDLAIQNKEVKLLLITRKFFCYNTKCSHKTFGERYNFVEDKAVRTKRLDDYINNIGLRDNSMDAVRTLKETGVNISNKTVLRIVKKKETSNKL